MSDCLLLLLGQMDIKANTSNLAAKQLHLAEVVGTAQQVLIAEFVELDGQTAIYCLDRHVSRVSSRFFLLAGCKNNALRIFQRTAQFPMVRMGSK